MPTSTDADADTDPALSTPPELLPPGTTDHTTTAAGQRLHYLTAGDEDGGRPLVLLHGGIIDAAHVTWGDLIPAFADDARVVAPDLPGYGASPVPEGEWSVPHHVDAVADLLRELDLADPVVAGVSMGGGVAVGLALQAPELVDRVVAVAPFALGGGLPNGRLTWALARLQVTNNLAVALMRRSRALVERSVNGLCYGDNEVSAATVDRAFGELQRPDAGAAFRKLRSYEVTREGYRTDYSPRLGELSVPVRYVHGREDEVVPVSVSERASERTPDAELFVLDRCGHLAPQERPDRAHELVAEVC